MFRQFTSCIVIVTFAWANVVPAYAQSVLNLPQPGEMIGLSQAFRPAILHGVRINPDNPFRFDFILDKGDAKNDRDRSLRDEATRLIKYFLAGVTIPEKDLWVNLSPYEKDRIVPEAFGQTEMGRDLLRQDYLLKQITASLLYPEGEVGKKFWAKVYAEAEKQYGIIDIPIDTFNKVWIVPEKAVVFENEQGAYIVESRLKVMLEADYWATANNEMPSDVGLNEEAPLGNPTITNDIRNDISKEVLREVVIPILEKEVNEGKNFAQLRQVYHSLILAMWFKDKVKENIFGEAYVDQNKTSGVDIEDKQEKEKIWAQYVESFKQGAYDLIKEEMDPISKEVIPRKYFSGGFGFQGIKDAAEITHDITKVPSGLDHTLRVTADMMMSPEDGVEEAPVGVKKDMDVGNVSSVIPESRLWAEGLFSLNPLQRIGTYLQLKETYDLQEAKRLREMYPRANIFTKKLIQSLFYWITRINGKITGQYYGITRTEGGRLRDIQNVLDPYLSELTRSFPGEKLKIRDEGVSTGMLSRHIFKHIAKRLKAFRYMAVDVVSSLIFISDQQEGYVAVFNDGDGKLTDNLIQVKKGEMLYFLDDKQELHIPGQNPRLFTKQVRDVLAAYRQGQTLPPRYQVGTLSSFDPEAEDLSKNDNRFSLSRHNIFDPVAPEEKAHFTIVSNVLVPEYYQHLQLIEGLRSVGRNTVEGGYVLVINEFTELGSRFPSNITSVFRRTGDALVCVNWSDSLPEIDSVGSVGFNHAKKAGKEAIREVDLRSPSVPSAGTNFSENGSRSFFSPFDMAEQTLAYNAKRTTISRPMKNTGGIDLTPERMNLKVAGFGDGIKFNFDPAIIQQLQNATGLTPVILHIQPMDVSVSVFLGV